MSVTDHSINFREKEQNEENSIKTCPEIQASQPFGFEATNNTESEFNWYVVNLKRRPDRLKLFKERCPLDTSKIKVLTACDGKTLTSFPNNFKGESAGVIGCFISHVLCWEETLKQKNSDYSVIFEDDAIFSKDFEKKFNDIINTNLDFNIIYIGGRFKENYKMINCIHVTDNIVKYDYKKWDPWDCDRTTHAYIISKKGCQLLLDNYNEYLKNNRTFPAVDGWMTHIYTQCKKEIHHSYPLLCHVPYVSDSDIRGKNK